VLRYLPPECNAKYAKDFNSHSSSAYLAFLALPAWPLPAQKYFPILLLQSYSFPLQLQSMWRSYTLNFMCTLHIHFSCRQFLIASVSMNRVLMVSFTPFFLFFSYSIRWRNQNWRIPYVLLLKLFNNYLIYLFFW
jgi:hypothetical protein